MGKAISIKSGIVQKQADYRRKKKILKWKQEGEKVEG